MGDYAGFIVGWSDWLSSCGAMAAVSLVVGEYSGKLIAVFTHADKAIAVTVLVGFAVLQWQGVRWGSRAQLITAAMKTMAFAVLVVACFISGRHASAASASLPVPALIMGLPLIVSIMLGLQAVFFTTDGWDGVIYFGEEVRDASRDVPRAIFGSVYLIMAIYLVAQCGIALRFANE